MSPWWSLIQLLSNSEIVTYLDIMLCLLICRRVFVILPLCIGHLPCDRHCSRGWGLRDKRWSSQLISSKECYGAHRSDTQCRPGRKVWVAGVVGDSFSKWVVSLLSAEGFEDIDQGKEVMRTFLAEQLACEPRDWCFSKRVLSAVLRGQMFLYETLPCAGRCWTSLPLGTKCQQYLLTPTPQYNSQKCPFTFPNAEPCPPPTPTHTLSRGLVPLLRWEPLLTNIHGGLSQELEYDWGVQRVEKKWGRHRADHKWSYVPSSGVYFLGAISLIGEW